MNKQDLDAIRARVASVQSKTYRDNGSLRNLAADCKSILDHIEHLEAKLSLHGSELVERLARASIFAAPQIRSSVNSLAEYMVRAGYPRIVADRDRYKAQIERVRLLHEEDDYALCSLDGNLYPCPTIQALGDDS